jgi:hypothetical protein
MALGISSRPNPDQMGRVDPNDRTKKLPDGPSHTQISYGPSRVMDWSYYSFAYTRLQEQDWAELTFHEEQSTWTPRSDGWGTGWRRRLPGSGCAAATPGVASLTLDSDFEVVGTASHPNIAFQMGAWWPGYGYFEKYDTFTLGRFRQIGEELTVDGPPGSRSQGDPRGRLWHRPGWLLRLWHCQG